MIKQVVNKVTGGSSRDKKIMKQSIYAFIMNVGSYLLAFGVMILLTRTLGAEGYGAYSFAATALTFGGVLALIGFEKLLVREVARQQANDRHEMVRGLYRWSNKLIFLASMVIAGIGIGISYLPMSVFSDPFTVNAFRISVCVIPLLALSRQRQSVLQGMKIVLLGQLPEKIIRPLLFLLFALLGYCVFTEWSAIQAALVNGCAFLVSFIYGQWLYRSKTRKLGTTEPSREEKRSLLISAGSLMLYSGASIISSKVDIFMLGEIQGSTREVGIYSVSIRISDLIGFFLVAFNIVVAPTIAELYAKGRKIELQNTLVRAARLIFVLSLPVILFLALARNWYLPFFGEEFIAASDSLLLLTLAMTINIAVGSVGYILLMTKHDKINLFILIFSTLMNIILNYILIPDYGMNGAAIATAVSIIFNNVTMLIFVMVKLKINPTALGRIRKPED